MVRGIGSLGLLRPVVGAILGVLLVAAPARADGAVDAMWPEHVEALADAGAELSGLIALHLDSSEEAREMSALFNTPTLQLPDRLSLEGKWLVRSLQVHQMRALIYDYFPCTIRREGPSGLILEKNSGSQRRLGLILGDYTEKAFLFLGGRYYADEAPRSYSGFQVEDVRSGGEGVDKRNDSVGSVSVIGKDRLLIIFAPVDGRSEMYELKRS